MSNFPIKWGFRQGLPHLGPQVRGFFPHRDKDGVKKYPPREADLRMGVEITLPTPQGPRIYENTKMPLKNTPYVYLCYSFMTFHM